MRVELNGEPTELPPGSSVADAVVSSGAPEAPRGIAVAVDGEVVPRSAWATTPLDEGQRVEVVVAVQGG
jgi:sulfur carrier protein